MKLFRIKWVIPEHHWNHSKEGVKIRPEVVFYTGLAAASREDAEVACQRLAAANQLSGQLEEGSISELLRDRQS